MRTAWMILVAAALAAGCGSGEGPTDGAVPDGASMCAGDADCDLGLFCSPRRCAPDDANADVLGCVDAEPACAEGELCDEARDRCLDPGCAVPDADGDGRDSVACGGDDCDDSNPARFPGNVEVCDGFGRDEDCDPTTLGVDMDADGSVSSSCCNAQNDGSVLCGSDCDDTRATVGPAGVEVCNGLDEDCDGTIDEGVEGTLYRDADGDGFGDAATATVRACGDPLFVSDNTDCDDGDATVRPGADEICDGVDNDCDGDANDEIDIDGDRHLALGSTCAAGTLPVDDCADTDAAVHGGAPDACNNVDDDCDGVVDERAGTDALCSSRTADATAVCTFSGNPALGNACLITACAVERGNCDGDVGNGCEADLLTDASNCGGCGLSCARGACVAGLCEAERAVPTQLALDVISTTTQICARFDNGTIGCRGATTGTAGRMVLLTDGDGSVIDDAVDISVDENGVACFTRSNGRVACPTETSVGRRFADVPGFEGVTRSFQGDDFLCGSTPSGVLCSGLDNVGQLGDGPGTAGGVVSVLAPGGGALVASDLSLGAETACAIESASGDVLCWGADTNGVLAATGARGSRDRPVPILDDVHAALVADRVFADLSHACALVGTAAYCWGLNTSGQADPASSPTLVARARRLTDTGGTPLEVTDVALAPGMTCVRGTDAAWRCFGSNSTGRTGNPASTTQLGPNASLSHAGQRSFVPDVVSGVPGVTCTSESGWLQCLGSNFAESLLAPSAITQTHLAIPGRMVSRTASIAVGVSHSCASTTSGRVLCWGRNATGAQQLAETGSFTANAPVVMPLDSVRQLAAAGDNTCALLDDGSVSCWGDADWGGRGDGTTADSTSLSVVSGLTDAVSIGLGMQHACALRASGDVVCWGNNEVGALGDGSLSHADCGGVDCSATPVTVTGLPAGVRVVQVGGGGLALGTISVVPGFTCARMGNGTVWCWGSNALGTLGDGTGLDSSTPVQVEGLDDVTDLGVSYAHACALRANGDVMCWGADYGLAAGRSLPLCRLGFSCATAPLRALTVGASRRLATTGEGACTEGVDGAVRCWGETTTGGSTALFPGDPIAGVVNLTGLAGGYGLACGVLASGDVRCWGPGARGALVPETDEPTTVLGL